MLIDSKGRLQIGDFGFACDNLSSLNEEQILLSKTANVGSEEYNAPELFERTQGTYDGVKADIFSAGVTLFLMLTKCPPFRSASSKDPYFRRLSSSDKKSYWKIFKGFDIDDCFRHLFESIIERDPRLRLNIDQVRAHEWFKRKCLTESELEHEIESRS